MYFVRAFIGCNAFDYLPFRNNKWQLDLCDGVKLQCENTEHRNEQVSSCG